MTSAVKSIDTGLARAVKTHGSRQSGRAGRRIALVVATLSLLCPVLLVADAPGAAAAPGLTPLKQGSVGTGVSCTQVAVNALIGSNLTVDGIYGYDTAVHVVAFQAYINAHYNPQPPLATDGVVGPQTGNYVWWIDYNIVGWIFQGCYPYVPTTS